MGTEVESPCGHLSSKLIYPPRGRRSMEQILDDDAWRQARVQRGMRARHDF